MHPFDEKLITELLTQFGLKPKYYTIIPYAPHIGLTISLTSGEHSVSITPSTNKFILQIDQGAWTFTGIPDELMPLAAAVAITSLAKKSLSPFDRRYPTIVQAQQLETDH